MKKLLSTTIAVGILATTSMTPVFANVAANTLPQLQSNGATNGSVSSSGNRMDVTVGTKNAENQGGIVGSFNWDSFNVGSEAQVNFEFTGHNQTAFNKVVGSDVSQIYGQITSSGCSGCGYADTGKVILINPNGVMFGDGANVNLNSFTVSTLGGSYDKENNKLVLDQKPTSNFGIVVGSEGGKGATLHGSKGLTFASNNVTIYKGSKLSTDIVNNVDDAAYGKIKIVTADGVNFGYYNNGAVKEVKDLKASDDKMVVSVEGGSTLESGNIDIRNASNNQDSKISLNNATLKATKATKGNDGNIWLTSNNDILIEDTTLQTSEATGSEAVNGANVRIVAGKKISLKNSKVDAKGSVDIISKYNDVVLADGTIVTSPKDVNIEAAGIASIQKVNPEEPNAETKSSKVQGKNVKIKGGTRAQVNDSFVVADEDVNIDAENVWFKNSNVKANKKLNATASNGYVRSDGATSLDAEEINLTAKTDVTGQMNLNNRKTTMKAETGKIDVTLANVAEKNNGLTAEAEGDVSVTTDGTLSVSRLVSKNGNMHLKAKKVIAGLPYTNEEKIPGDDSPRSYIYVKNGTFTSDVEEDNFTVTASDKVTPDGKHKERHHIQYGDEKILLINDREYEPEVAHSATPSIDQEQAQRINKLPRQPETYSNVANVSDGRTSFVDVFAAASQIEIEEDED